MNMNIKLTFGYGVDMSCLPVVLTSVLVEVYSIGAGWYDMRV